MESRLEDSVLGIEIKSEEYSIKFIDIRSTCMINFFFLVDRYLEPL